MASSTRCNKCACNENTIPIANMTKSVNGWVRKMESIVASKRKEVAKVRSFRKFKLPGQKKMEHAAEQGLAQAKRDLQYVKRLRLKYIKEGKINKN